MRPPVSRASTSAGRLPLPCRALYGAAASVTNCRQSKGQWKPAGSRGCATSPRACPPHARRSRLRGWMGAKGPAAQVDSHVSRSARQRPRKTSKAIAVMERGVAAYGPLGMKSPCTTSTWRLRRASSSCFSQPRRGIFGGVAAVNMPNVPSYGPDSAGFLVSTDGGWWRMKRARGGA
jgi:hypothetical protein